jgi:hypothetical protein
MPPAAHWFFGIHDGKLGSEQEVDQCQVAESPIDRFASVFLSSQPHNEFLIQDIRRQRQRQRQPQVEPRAATRFVGSFDPTAVGVHRGLR